MTAKSTRKAKAPARSSSRKPPVKKTERFRPGSDPIDSIWKSRERERRELFESQQELREMVQESQLRILAMRTKCNTARLKLINKGFDD